jgi:regulatory protein
MAWVDARPSEASAKQGADSDAAARATVLRLLAKSPKSRAQLAEAMAKKSIPPSVVAEVLDRFEKVGLVDDPAFAEMLVRSRHRDRGLVGRVLAAELTRRGVDHDTARAAMEQVGPEDEAARARELAARKLAATRELPREVRLRRTYAVLTRKGYGEATARRAVASVLAAEQLPQDGTG